MHWDDVRLTCGGELLLFFLVSRRSFDSSKFIFLASIFQLCNGNYKVYLTPILGRVFEKEIAESVALRLARGRCKAALGRG